MDAASGAQHNAAINFQKLASAIDKEASIDRTTATGKMAGHQVTIGLLGKDKPVKFEMATQEMVNQFMKMSLGDRQQNIGLLQARLQQVKNSPNFKPQGQQTNAKIQLAITVPMLTKQIKSEVAVKEGQAAAVKNSEELGVIGKGLGEKYMEDFAKVKMSGGSPQEKIAEFQKISDRIDKQLNTAGLALTKGGREALQQMKEGIGQAIKQEQAASMPKPDVTVQQKKPEQTPLPPLPGRLPPLPAADSLHSAWNAKMDSIINSGAPKEQKVAELKTRLSTMEAGLKNGVQAGRFSEEGKASLQQDIQRCKNEIQKLTTGKGEVEGSESEDEQTPKGVQPEVKGPVAKPKEEEANEAEGEEGVGGAKSSSVQGGAKQASDGAELNNKIGNILYGNKSLPEKIDALKALNADIATQNQGTSDKGLDNLIGRLEKDQKVFSGQKSADLKSALVELYSAEGVFMNKLSALRGDPSLTPEDASKLEQLISNTNVIIGGLGSGFSQVGAQQQTELRTLKQDFSNALNYQSMLPETKKYNSQLADLVKLQGEIGRVSGEIMFPKQGADVPALEAERKALQSQFVQDMEKLGKINHPAIQKISQQYERIVVLEEQCANLPAIPVGLFESLNNTFNSDTVKTQYELLGHFAKKLEVMKDALDPNFNKYQELGNKLTRYPMLLGAIQGNIPKDAVPEELTNVQQLVNANLKMVNENK